MINKIFYYFRLLIYKFKFGNRFVTTKKQMIRKDTYIIIKDEGRIKLNSCSFSNNVHLTSIGGKLEIGSKCFFNRNCIVICRKSISIGDNSLFGPNVCIYDHDHTFDTEGVNSNSYKCSDVVIGPNCWIGAGSIILRGSTIGEGSVIGAGCVIKGNIPAHSIVTQEISYKIRSIEASEDVTKSTRE